MAGLEPARANYSPTDFKSVASTIPPHRRCIGSLSIFEMVKMNFAMSRDIRAPRKTLNVRMRHEKASYLVESASTNIRNAYVKKLKERQISVRVRLFSRTR